MRREIVHCLNLILCPLLFLMCSSSSTNEMDDQEANVTHELARLCSEESGNYCGYAIVKGKNDTETFQIASNMALGNLVQKIKVDILSVIENCKKETYSNNVLLNELSWFRKHVVEESSVLLPQKIVPTIYRQWINKDGLYYIAMIVTYNPNEFPFHKMISFQIDGHVELITELDKVWSARTAKNK